MGLLCSGYILLWVCACVVSYPCSLCSTLFSTCLSVPCLSVDVVFHHCILLASPICLAWSSHSFNFVEDQVSTSFGKSTTWPRDSAYYSAPFCVGVQLLIKIAWKRRSIAAMVPKNAFCRFFFFFFHLTYSRWTSSLPSCLWSQRIFPSLPGSRLTIFLSRCKFSTLTTRQPMVEFYLLTFPRFPLRKKEHKSYFGKNRTHDFRTSRCAAYLLDHSGDEQKSC